MTGLEVDIRLDRGAFRLEVRESFAATGITAVFGASGSGKTSLLRVLAGLEPTAAGSVRFRDRDWTVDGRATPPEQRKLGYVFQDGRLFSHLDVLGNLSFPRKHGRRHGAITLDDVVAALDLEPLLTRSVHSLSGGESQRVAIGRALLADPCLMLMDEPLSSLDVARKRDLLPLIRSLPKRFEIPILYVTHDIDELTYLADSVVLLSQGRNVAHGSLRDILARPDFARLTELDDPGLVLEARVSAHGDGLTIATLGSGELRLPEVGASPGETIRLRVHPRDVILATTEPEGISIRNRLRAEIIAVEPHEDGQVTVRLGLGEQLLAARITRRASEDLGLAPGQTVFALIKSVALDAIA
jgi:molybdate transport system ATP-binding protein